MLTPNPGFLFDSLQLCLSISEAQITNPKETGANVTRQTQHGGPPMQREAVHSQPSKKAVPCFNKFAYMVRGSMGHIQACMAVLCVCPEPTDGDKGLE